MLWMNQGYEIGRKYGVPLEMFGLTEQTYLKAMYKYGGTVGSTHPAKLIQVPPNPSIPVTLETAVAAALAPHRSLTPANP